MSNTNQNPQNQSRILIIDDNPSLVNVFAKMLQTKGFFVTTETILKNGLQRLENETYHVVFVDAPIDGYNVNQILTIFDENKLLQKALVVLFSSADIEKTELDKWKKNGLYSYIKKPVKHNVMIKIIDDIWTQTNSDNYVSSIEKHDSVQEPPTPEQLARLAQLEAQIQELESQRAKPIPSTVITQKEATTEMEKILSEISQLKNQVQLLDEPNDEIHHNHISSIPKKKPKKSKAAKKLPTKSIKKNSPKKKALNKKPTKKKDAKVKRKNSLNRNKD